MANVLGRSRHIIGKQRDGTPQDNSLGDLAQRRRLKVALEPGRQIPEVHLGILHGRAAQNPLATTAQSHQRAEAARLGSVANGVTLIQHDTVPHGLLNHILRAP